MATLQFLSKGSYALDGVAMEYKKKKEKFIMEKICAKLPIHQEHALKLLLNRLDVLEHRLSILPIFASF